MDQNGSLLDETSNSNKYFLFIKKTLQFLVPVSLLSFLLTCASSSYGFSFIFTYNFNFSTLVFPLFSRSLERKYMFLICNGILAFLAKTLSFNSSSDHIDNFIQEEPIKTNKDNVKPTSETTLIQEEIAPFEKATAISNIDVKLEGQEEQKEEEDYEYDQEKGPHEEEKEAKFLMGSSLIIESVEEEEEDIDDEIEESVSLLGGSVGEEVINLNTEELNQKFEEFIRKMKEEIRIEAQQQLVVA